jgi:putative phosphoesterase
VLAKLQDKDNFLVGVISDTHGVLPPAAVKAFEGTDLIIHAGDIGKADILKALRSIAPVVAVRGNMDYGEWAYELRETEVVEVGKVLLYVLHDVYGLDTEPSVAGFSAVISGHSHRPSVEHVDGVLFLNPGSAGQPGFRGPASVALLHVRGISLDAQFVELKGGLLG